MNLDGAAVLHADPEKVWTTITDPAVLARTIPGCESLERVGADSYRMNVSVGVGAIRGTYAGEVHLTDQRRPSSYVMHASGAGAPGQVRATVAIDLRPSAEGTTLTYSADAVVGGPVAGVGQRMMTGVAKRMASQFFAAVDRELSGVVPIGAAPSAEARAAEARDAGAREAVAREAVAREAVARAAEALARTGGAPAEPASTTGQVFAGRAVPAPADLRPLLVGAAGGGLLTLLGVVVGYLLGRRR